MVGRLHEKVALVVGAGSVGPGWGNGKAAAVLFAREGAKVLCADVNEDAANETVQIIRQENGTANAICADVTSHGDKTRPDAHGSQAVEGTKELFRSLWPS
jgi:NAD(P)-dependent dehydrogenase (short-subunit alcohol dehydrogenase family)